MSGDEIVNIQLLLDVPMQTGCSRTALLFIHPRVSLDEFCIFRNVSADERSRRFWAYPTVRFDSPALNR